MIYRILVDELYHADWFSRSYVVLTDTSWEALQCGDIPADVLKKLAHFKNKRFPTEEAFVVVLEKFIGKRYCVAYASVISQRLEKGQSVEYHVAIPWNHQEGQKLIGASYGWLADVMSERGLCAPHITNPRARFYFTELGWEKVGRYVASEAKRLGHVTKVIKRKEPDRSQVVYQDELQIAVLPKKRRATS